MWGFENFPGKTSTEGKLGRPGAPGTTKAKEVVGKEHRAQTQDPFVPYLGEAARLNSGAQPQPTLSHHNINMQNQIEASSHSQSVHS